MLFDGNPGLQKITSQTFIEHLLWAKYCTLQDLPLSLQFLSDSSITLLLPTTYSALAILASLFLKPIRYTPNLGSMHRCSL